MVEKKTIYLVIFLVLGLIALGLLAFFVIGLLACQQLQAAGTECPRIGEMGCNLIGGKIAGAMGFSSGGLFGAIGSAVGVTLHPLGAICSTMPF
jgi:hypothetical protein